MPILLILSQSSKLLFSFTLLTNILYYSFALFSSLFSAVVFNCIIHVGVAAISIKNNLVLDYIEGLPEGAKVSVRELAAKLQVSEGTAYKAVKQAEQLGLVTVKAKAGTIRVSAQQPAFDQSVSAADVVRILGLTVLTGRQNLSIRIRKLIVCDGSEKDLLRQMDSAAPGECLCLCGERPDMQTAVLELGAHLLLTGGAKSNWVQTNLAERKELLVLSSPQSAYSLLRLFDGELLAPPSSVGNDQVSAWMQAPDYLYYNDVVADWQRLFTESPLPKHYPVVDENLELFGSLDVWKAAADVPSQKIRSVLASGAEVETVQASDALKDVARRFILNGDNFAAVLDGKRMLGIITANDLLRYYMGLETAGGESSLESFLSKDNAVSDEDTVVYQVRVPDAVRTSGSHLALSLLTTAAESHLRQRGCGSYQLTSGTILAPRPLVFSESLMLVSRIQPGAPGSYMIEAELNDDSVSYAKMMIIASEPARNTE